MELDELKRQSWIKVLLKGKSGRGKTRMCSKIALTLSRDGISVLYVDTESEASTTMVKFIEDGEYEESDLQNVTYKQVSDYDSLVDHIGDDAQEEYDVIIVDTLDHKHTFALEKVTGEKRKANADWNQYPQIYSREKEIMEALSKPSCNIIATLDPDSGKVDKPKGAQTNIHGYFNIVIKLIKDGDSWGNKTRNYVGWSDAIGKKIPDLDEQLTDEIRDRVSL
jgi:hypothetical protein